MFQPAKFVDDSLKLLESIITGEESFEKKFREQIPAIDETLYNETFRDHRQLAAGG